MEMKLNYIRDSSLLMAISWMRCFKLSHWHVHFFINSKSLKQVTLPICRKKTNSWSNHTDCSHSSTKVNLRFSYKPVLLCSLVVCEENMSSYRQTVSRKVWGWPSYLKPLFRLLAPWWPAEQPPGHEHLGIMLPVADCLGAQHKTKM